jgi:hypothetical protein
MVREPSHVKQLSLNHVCKIGLINCLANTYESSLNVDDYSDVLHYNG